MRIKIQDIHYLAPKMTDAQISAWLDDRTRKYAPLSSGARQVLAKIFEERSKSVIYRSYLKH